ncbi:A24 family peptidase [Uliginosibacterium aquaticum]|uniref:A24 family peptidase n=1 Tax=Uliginosibacterium aquaticum TaxID=2731212 RepID=UPI001C2D1F4F|nr:prepilin peptidase [Uliginosibacterium aquaticum]
MPAVALLLGLSLWHDIASRRIPNRVVLAGLIAGLALQLLLPAGGGLFMASAGSLGILSAGLGVVIGGVLLLPLYAFRVMGAGDVKLMAALGAFLGPLQVSGAVLLSLVAGGVLALVVALFTRALPQVMDNLRLMLLCTVAGRGSGLKISDLPTTGRLPYALAIACGTLAQILLARFTSWPLA